VNTTLYDPALHTPLDLRAKSQLVFGKHWEAKLAERATSQGLNAATTSQASATGKQTLNADGGTAALRSSDSSGSSSSRGDTGSSGSRGGGSSSGDSRGGGGSSGGGLKRPFRFISTFKWEPRKGWDILLEAYITAFTAEDDVE
jgi:hypothetical protein